MAQLVEHPTSARVMILRFVSSSPTSGLLLSSQSLLRPLSLSVSTPPPLVCARAHSLSLSKINKHLKINLKKDTSQIEWWGEGNPTGQIGDSTSNKVRIMSIQF